MSVYVITMKIRIDLSSPLRSWPVVFINEHPYRPLIEFMAQRHMRPQTAKKLAEAVKKLMQFMLANDGVFERPNKIFESFVRCLYDGTIDENGEDASGLYWSKFERSPPTVRAIVNRLTSLFDWLELHEYSGIHPNPWTKSTSVEEKIRWAAYMHKKQNAFLGHLMGRTAATEYASKTRQAILRKNPKNKASKEVKFFPPEHFETLLLNGFVLPKHRKNSEELTFISPVTHDIRGIMIALLMNAGGRRVSETMHLWVTDVIPDVSNQRMAYVRVYHPEMGMAPTGTFNQRGEEVLESREKFLASKYPLYRPRNTLPSDDRLFAGWKDLRLTDVADFFVEVFWFPQHFGELFLDLFNQYLAIRANTENAHKHPFLFVDRKGNPYSIADYRKAHSKAVSRIGLPSGKRYGTTEHGHRHAYGQRLSEYGADPLTIMAAMAHKSIESQTVYTDPTVESIKLKLLEATKNARAGKLPLSRHVKTSLKSILGSDNTTNS